MSRNRRQSVQLNIVFQPGYLLVAMACLKRLRKTTVNFRMASILTNIRIVSRSRVLLLCQPVQCVQAANLTINQIPVPQTFSLVAFQCLLEIVSYYTNMHIANGPALKVKSVFAVINFTVQQFFSCSKSCVF